MQRFVYFIRATESGRIKIGVADDPIRRLADLQTGSPEVLELLGAIAGARSLEVRLHAELHLDRLHGEWFTCSDQVLFRIGTLLGWGRLTPEQERSAALAEEIRRELKSC